MTIFIRVSSLGLLLALSGQAMAVESSTVGSRTNQSNVDVLNSKIDALAAQLQAVNTCTALRKFYAPADPKKDASNCVGSQDYQFTMNNTSGLATSNGQLNVTNSNTGNTWAAIINNTQTGGYGLVAYGVNGHGLEGISTGGYGVVGISTNGLGVYGNSPNNWSGYFSGLYGAVGVGTSGLGVQGVSTGSYGVYGTSTNSTAVQGSSTNGWGGGFTGTYGVNTSNTSGYYSYLAYGGYGLYTNGTVYTPTLCLSGVCKSAWPSSKGPGGSYALWNGGCGANGSRAQYNPLTGNCSCPPGYSGYTAYSVQDKTNNNWTLVGCY